MNFWQAIVLAIVEGLTEFLPVSSTGHMIIASSIMGIAADEFVKMYTVGIQLGAIISVMVLYSKRFLKIDVNFYVKLFLGFLPAAVIGFLCNDYIDALLENVVVVAIALVVGGLVFLWIDQIIHQPVASTAPIEPSAKKAFIIGIFQCLAMVPGVSRSAATIIGGLTQGLHKKAAAEFSFFLAAPTMLAATGYKMLKFYQLHGGFTAAQLQLFAVGNLVALLVAIVAIKTFISYITNHGFKVFGYYRIIVGVAILILYYMGFSLQIV
ncbi:MAG: hypothetical protein RIQ89_1347 [Bacteroidota bacterium]|jgi:undecaprenyl-diphosphatase